METSVFYFFNRKMKLTWITKDYQDRDLVILTGLEDDVLEKYDMNSDFDLILIGKDGSIKYRAHGVSNPEKIYSIIDQMPRRQKEMRP